MLSGVGGDIGEAEELLVVIKEALRAQEEAKIRKGEELVMSATERVPSRDDAAVKSDEEGEDARPKKNLCDNVRLGGNVFAGEVDRFEDSIRESEHACIALKCERPLFEKKRFEREM